MESFDGSKKQELPNHTVKVQDDSERLRIINFFKENFGTDLTENSGVYLAELQTIFEMAKENQSDINELFKKCRQ